MTELTSYKCDICGETFDDDHECYCHEAFHKIHSILETEGTKFFFNGTRATPGRYKTIDDFLASIDAIEVANPEAAQEINDFYNEEKYNKPFENVNSKHVYFDEYSGEWCDADQTIKGIKAKFGE